MKEYSYEKLVKDPDVFADLRLPAHSDHLAFASADEMTDGRTSLREYLDGVWKFHYAKNIQAAPARFWEETAETDSWDSIRVPAHIQLEGWDKPSYVNTQYPWDSSEELLPGEIPEYFNPVADYVTEFVLPERFRGKEVTICFEGVESGFAVWLNGQYMGYSEDSFDASEFSLMPALREGRNRLAVRVFKWTPGSWFEDQDFYRFSGIFRSVYLSALPETGVVDLAVVPTLDESLAEGSLEVCAETKGTGFLRLSLFRRGVLLEKKDAAITDNAAGASFRVQNPDLWSAEEPNLYSLYIEVFNQHGALTEVMEQKLGFRRFELKDGLMLLNGKRIVFKGVNRHDFSSVCGRVPNREELLRDIVTMKRNNINAVRTSHYPNQTALYEMCDEYGLYVIDENNMETHGTWDAFLRGQAGADYVIPKDHTEFQPMLLDRVRSLYQRDKNHTCVLIWSCGNESYGGSVIREMSMLFRRCDPNRLVHYEGVHWDPSYPETSDIYSQMYTPVSEIETFLAEHPDKPFICCEYTHAMGNSCGGMHKYTDLSDREPRYQGGFIWDYVDQSLYKRNRYGEWFQAYGGDFGERPTDYQFSGNGIVYGGDRSPSPKMQEVKFNYQNITVDFSNTGFRVKNKNLFLRTSAFRCDVILSDDGAERLRTEIETDVPPLSQGEFELPSVFFELMVSLEKAAVAADRPLPEFSVTVSFSLREDTLWAKAGHEVAFGQKVFKRERAAENCGEPLTVIFGKHNIGVRGSRFSVQFAGVRPGLSSYVYDGVEYIDQSPSPNFWRAPVENDRANGMPQRYAQWKIASLYAAPLSEFGSSPFEKVEKREHSVLVSFAYTLPTRPASRCTVGYEVFGDGTVRVSLDYKAVKGLPDMPEFGMLFKLSADYDRFIWYGLGPEDTYVDRCRGGKLGVYEKSVKENMARYLTPQESGNKCGVRWARVVDRRGRGMLFYGNELSVNVLPFTPHELENALHPYELPPVHHTVVRVALQQMGIAGDNTWGARTHPEYLLPAEQDLSLSFSFRGI